MYQIQDAPWIREAELFGMPPYEDNSEFETASENAAKELLKADKLIDDIVSNLLNAEAILMDFEVDYDDARSMNQSIRDMIYKMEDAGCDFRTFAEKLNGRR